FMPISHSSTISMEMMPLLYAYMIERSINFGKIILKEIHDFARKKARSAYFPSLIALLWLRAQVRSKENLKGCYVQGYITRHDLEKLVENVELLNQVEPDGLNELESDKSSTKSKPKANSINAIEEAEIGEEPKNLNRGWNQMLRN
ncbi:hypothetical protein J1N35_011322, partial [Gossypium stocksii]